MAKGAARLGCCAWNIRSLAQPACPTLRINSYFVSTSGRARRSPSSISTSKTKRTSKPCQPFSASTDSACTPRGRQEQVLLLRPGRAQAALGLELGGTARRRGLLRRTRPVDPRRATRQRTERARLEGPARNGLAQGCRRAGSSTGTSRPGLGPLSTSSRDAFASRGFKALKAARTAPAFRIPQPRQGRRRLRLRSEGRLGAHSSVARRGGRDRQRPRSSATPAGTGTPPWPQLFEMAGRGIARSRSGARRRHRRGCLIDLRRPVRRPKAAPDPRPKFFRQAERKLRRARSRLRSSRRNGRQASGGRAGQAARRPASTNRPPPGGETSFISSVPQR